MGLAGVDFDVEDLSAIGVKRISVGSGLARAAFGAFLHAAREMRERGTFKFAEDAIPFRDLSEMF
jgi:2-methylisocitrate lyase-like PEP mutase family enzyme